MPGLAHRYEMTDSSEKWKDSASAQTCRKTPSARPSLTGRSVQRRTKSRSCLKNLLLFLGDSFSVRSAPGKENTSLSYGLGTTWQNPWPSTVQVRLIDSSPRRPLQPLLGAHIKFEMDMSVSATPAPTQSPAGSAIS